MAADLQATDGYEQPLTDLGKALGGRAWITHRLLISCSHGLLSVYSRPTLTDLISRLKDVRNEVRKLNSGRIHYVHVHFVRSRKLTTYSRLISGMSHGSLHTYL